VSLRRAAGVVVHDRYADTSGRSSPPLAIARFLDASR
jgi:hypothetical protein